MKNKLYRTALRGLIFALTLVAFAALPQPTAAAIESCENLTAPDRAPSFYGQYYNFSEDKPWSVAYRGRTIPNPVIGGANPFYDQRYLSFSRTDYNLDFGARFFPVDEGLAGDPNHFAVHWRAVLHVPADAAYTLTIRADDDAWLLVDDQLLVDLNGVHAPQTRRVNPQLRNGNHRLDIYFAERAHRSGSTFSFRADERLNFYALPPGCAVPPLARTSAARPTTTPRAGRVLGAETSRTPYTPAVALLRAAGSPDVYAVYANGTRHHVSGPTAFARYGYRTADVRVVPNAALARYPVARLLRTPDDPTIYYIYERPQGQWLKITVPSPTVFASYAGNHWGDVVVVDELDLKAYPNAALIRTATQPDAVYLLTNNEKRRFGSMDILHGLGYNLAEVVDVSPTHLETYRVGEVIG
jgi:fibro-slime domain-containing protein